MNVLLACWLALAQVTTISGSGSTVVSGSGSTKLVMRWLMLFGDSKTALGATTTWPPRLQDSAESEAGAPWSVANAGLGGTTVAAQAAAVTTTLATMPGAANMSDIRVLINLGVNDISGGLPVEATWNANYLTLIDAIHVKWPTARIYLMRPWLQGEDTDAATVKTRIATIIAARPTFVFAGPDEAVWLKGSDDGATMTSDGTHYSAAGNAEAVTQWISVLFP